MFPLWCVLWPIPELVCFGMSLCFGDWHVLFVNMTQLILSVELINDICVKLARLADFSIIIINIEFSRFSKTFLFLQ